MTGQSWFGGMAEKRARENVDGELNVIAFR